MKIYDFGHGSIQVSKSQSTIHLPQSQSLPMEEGDLEDIQTMYRQDPDTLPLEHVYKENGRVTLVHEVPSGFINLEAIKKQSLPVRIAAMNQLMEREPLQRTSYVSLHPSTLFFRPMTHIRFGYVASSKMPKETEYTALEKYKALAYALIARQSYEDCLRHEEKAYQRKKTMESKREHDQIIKLLKTIAQANTVPELKKDIQDSYEYTQYQYFQEMTRVQQRFKHRLYTLGASAFMVLLIGIFGTFFMASQETQATAQHYKQQLEQKTLTIQTLQSAKDQDYQEAIHLMEKQGKSKQDIAQFLIEEGQYQRALEVHSESLKEVVATLYETNQQEKILDLELKGSQRMEDEKAIVAFHQKELEQRKNFIEDPELAHRMAVAFLRKNDLDSAQYLAEKFDDQDLLQQIAIQKDQEKKESQIKELEQEMTRLKKRKEHEEDKDQRKDIDQRIKDVQQKLSQLKGES